MLVYATKHNKWHAMKVLHIIMVTKQDTTIDFDVGLTRSCDSDCGSTSSNEFGS